MAILNVGPSQTYLTIAAAMAAAGPGDSIVLETGYGDETASVTHNAMIISGDATSTGIVLQLDAGIATIFLAGTSPIDVLAAPSGGHGISSNGGDNVVTVLGGVNAVNGGLGTDRLVVDYSLATGAVTGDTTANVTDAGGYGSVTITGGTFEHFTVLTGSGADTITAGDGDNIIDVADGANTVTAGNGANNITGGNGVDTITAGDGGNTIDGGDGANTIISGAGDDTIVSGVAAATIVAGGGADTVTVRGGAGTVDSGAGNDRLIVDYSALLTDVTGGVTGGNVVSGFSGHIADSTAANVIDFVGTENFAIYTGSGSDTIVSGGGSDILTTGAGNDTLDAGAGVDQLTGGAGDDDLDGGADQDTAIYAGDRTDYSVSLAGATFTVTDLRAGSPDGIDTVTNVESFEFNGVTYTAASVLNDIPVLTGDLIASVSEGGAYVIAAADLGFADPDDAAADVTFTVSNLQNGALLVDGVAAGSFTGAQLEAGAVSFQHDGSETTTALFSVAVEDGNEDGSPPIASTFNFAVTSVNDAPVITSGGGGETALVTIAENTTVVTTVIAGDPDNAQPLTFSLAGGADAALFTIDQTTGVVAFLTAPDFEAPADTNADNAYEVIVQVSDGVGGTDVQPITVTVTDVGTVLSITSGATGTAVENAAASTVIYDTSASSEGDVGGPVSFALSSGGDSDLFSINATTGEVAFKVSPDFESPADVGGDNVYDIVVHANDGLVDVTKAVAITVTNLDDTPVTSPVASISATSASKAEGNSGTTPFLFTIALDSVSATTQTLNWSVAGSGSDAASAADFEGGAFPSGIVTFAAGETVKQIAVNVMTDTTAEEDEQFTVSLSNASSGVTIGDALASGTIFNDDQPAGGDGDPDARNDAYIVLQGQQLDINSSSGLLFNDENVSPNSATLIGEPQHGSMQLNANGGFSYTATDSFAGIDTFAYRVSDGLGGVDTSEGQIYVVPVDVGPDTTTLSLFSLSREEQVAATYTAFFGRGADADGFEFWVDQFSSNQSKPADVLFADVASSFGISDEAKDMYAFLQNPHGASDDQIGDFLDSVYDNLFNRSTEAEGRAYWTAEIKQSLASDEFVGSVLIDIIGGSQDTAAGLDITTLMSKVAVNIEYVQAQQQLGSQWTAADDRAESVALLEGVGAAPQTVLIGFVQAHELVLADVA